MKPLTKILYPFFSLLLIKSLYAQIPWQLTVNSATTVNTAFSDKDLNQAEVKLKENSSLKFSAGGFNSAVCVKTPYVKLNSDFFTELSLQSINYGMEYRFSPSSRLFTTTFSAGHIKYSGIYSQFSSPAIYTGTSSLKKNVLLSSSVFSSLPSSSSESSKLCISAGISPGLKSKYIPSFQIALIEKQGICSSISKNIKLPQKITLTPSAAVFLQLKGFNFSDTCWFSDKVFYPQNLYASGIAQLNLTSSILKSGNSFVLNQNPFGLPVFCLKSQNLLCAGNFNFHVAAFYSSKNFFNADSSFQKQKFQYLINPQYDFKFRNSTLNTGLLFMENFCRTNSYPSYSYEEYIAKAQIFYQKKTSFFSAQTGFNYSSQDNTYGIDQKATVFLHKTKYSSTSSFSFSADFLKSSQKMSCSLSQNFNFYIKYLNSFNTSISFTGKDSSIKTNLCSDISFSFNTKNFKANLKISGDFSI